MSNKEILKQGVEVVKKNWLLMLLSLIPTIAVAALDLGKIPIIGMFIGFAANYIIIKCALLCVDHPEGLPISETFKEFNLKELGSSLGTQLALLLPTILLAIPLVVASTSVMVGSLRDYAEMDGVGLIAMVYMMMIILVSILLAFYIMHFFFFPAIYLCVDQPRANPFSVLSQSYKLMKGQKWRLFKLELVIWFMMALSGLAFGITLIFVVPYTIILMSLFYVDIMGQTLPSDVE